jgi:uncharacterized protein (TIGR04255 family)
MLGLSEKLEGDMKHSLSELVLRQPEHQLTARIALLSGKIGVPADLAPFTLVLPQRIKEINGLHAVLDNDSVQKRRFHYDIDKATESLKAVKKQVNEAFKNSVTQDAIDYWRGN